MQMMMVIIITSDVSSPPVAKACSGQLSFTEQPIEMPPLSGIYGIYKTCFIMQTWPHT
jgi:hypothetical protein